jgi:hypothetical protein
MIEMRGEAVKKETDILKRRTKDAEHEGREYGQREMRGKEGL